MELVATLLPMCRIVYGAVGLPVCCWEPFGKRASCRQEYSHKHHPGLRAACVRCREKIS